MVGIEPHERWLAEFEGAGEVTVRQSRVKIGMGLVAFGAVFIAWGLFLLPAPGRLVPGPVTDVVGVLAVVFGLTALAFGIRTLVRPPVVVHLGPDGLRPPVGPVVSWREVVDAGMIGVANTQLPAVTVDPAYLARGPNLTGWRRAAWEVNASRYGPTVLLRHAPPGGNEQVVRLILAARDRMAGSR